MKDRAILWLRRDLRVADNPALHAALAHEEIVPAYIHAPDEQTPWAPGGAQRVWLHQSLHAMDARLRALGSRLVIRHGPTLAALRELAAESGATAVYWNRLYEPAVIERDKHIKKALRDDGLTAESHNAALLCEPWQIATRAGDPYKVFTPFWRNLQQRTMAAPLAAPDALPEVWRGIGSQTIDSLQLLPAISWDAGIRAAWTPGENAAHDALDAFLDAHVTAYKEHRDVPAQPGTSRLSPHLHFGEIGPRQVWHRVHEWLNGRERIGADTFLGEVAWREFSHHLLYHFPHTPQQPLAQRFEAFPWLDDGAGLAAWQAGRTGVPLVDAGMRELWASGWMHNRVRMVVASFLTKNLRIAWQTGARWFWDTLVDADLANNTLGWQWAAGCGADAAPYFRIFNPVRQGQRFDPDGDYVRRWVPELAALEARDIHAPWQAPVARLEAAGLCLGHDYPQPIVDLQASRRAALAAYDAIKS